METRSRWRRGRGSGAKDQESGVRSQESEPAKPKSKGEGSDKPTPTPSQQPTPTEDAPTIRKGVYLSVLIYVEGEMPAPEDFTSQATGALKDALGEAFKAHPGGLSMSVKRVEVQNDVEESESNDDADKEEEKFQF